MSSFWTSAGLLVLGAALGLVPAYITEQRREKNQLATRWDTALHTHCADFVASARRLRHLALRLAEAPQEDALRQQLDDEHARLRGLTEQVRLLGTGELQTAVRLAVRHAFAVREVAEGRPDPRAAEYPGQPPDERLQASLREVRRAARVQLRVANPDDLPPDP